MICLGIYVRSVTNKGCSLTCEMRLTRGASFQHQPLQARWNDILSIEFNSVTMFAMEID
jgi:hypothetical protein